MFIYVCNELNFWYDKYYYYSWWKYVGNVRGNKFLDIYLIFVVIESEVLRSKLMLNNYRNWSWSFVEVFVLIFGEVILKWWLWSKIKFKYILKVLIVINVIISFYIIFIEILLNLCKLLKVLIIIKMMEIK